MSVRVWDDREPGWDKMPGSAAAAEAAGETVFRLDELRRRYSDLTAPAVLQALIRHEFCGRLAVVSSFGAESAVLLALVAAIDRSVPIVFLDTGKLFGETLRYRDRLVALLGLSDVRTIEPRSEDLAAVDAEEMLWRSDPDRCCALRKVAPLAKALDGFAAWVSGRKRYQGSTRARLAMFEADGAGRIKINPLAGWSRADIEAFLVAGDLPQHPLVAEGYLSIGCMTCTDRVTPGEDPRAGRWRGRAKTECGIHLDHHRIRSKRAAMQSDT
jgi:phosphoadenosine phosphosulfate reductase